MVKDPLIDSPYCTNCGTELTGIYCHKCGQKKIEIKDRSVKAFVIHFFEEFFTFDSKFFRSMKYLIFRPGYLTHEYISGRFVRYVTPLKMYLFTSIIVFFILLKIEPDTYTSFMEPRDTEDFIQNTIVEYREAAGMSEEEFGQKFNTINDLITPGLFIVMIIFSVSLKLIYFNKHIFYVEHLVFTLHFFSMVLIFFTVGAFLNELNLDIQEFLIFFAPCVYLLFAVKTVYHSKWLFAGISALIMSFVYVMLVVLWVLGMIAVTLMKI